MRRTKFTLWLAGGCVAAALIVLALLFPDEAWESAKSAAAGGDAVRAAIKLVP